MANSYIFKDKLWVYSDIEVTEEDRVMWSIYSADPGVDRHHLISISPYATMKKHSIYPNFWSHSICLRFRGSSTPVNVMSSQQIPTLLKPKPLSQWAFPGASPVGA
jgi:hypothetical protein